MKKWLSTLIAAGVGLALMALSLALQGLPALPRDWFLVLSNAAFLPGVLFTSAACLALIFGKGGFDGTGYVLRSFARKKREEYPTYADYAGRERRRFNILPLLLPGVVYLALAILFAALCYL